MTKNKERMEAQNRPYLAWEPKSKLVRDPVTEVQGRSSRVHQQREPSGHLEAAVSRGCSLRASYLS